MGVASTAIAMETGGYALMTNDLQKLAVPVRLGQKSRRKILQNIVLSITTRVLVIVLAAVGYASLWGAVLVDVGTCLLVIFNNMMLLERKKDESGCLGLFAFRQKRISKVCQKDVLLSSEKYVDLKAEPWCPKKMEDNKVFSHGTKQDNEYYLSYCATKSCCEVRCANNDMRRRVNNRDACEKDCQCIAIDEGLLVSSDAADVGSEVRDSLMGGSSEGDVESVRPDICFAVGVISRFSNNPREAHWAAGMRILKYIKGTLDHGIFYKQGLCILHGFCDSDWAGDNDSRKSVSGYCFSLGSGIVSWISKKQPTVALSSTEAEYKVACFAACEAVWLRRILTDLGVQVATATTLQCNNQSCMAIAKNLVFHARTKHIEIQYHYVCELIEDEIIELEYCPTLENQADIFTKPLPSNLHYQHLHQLGIGPRLA
ncbi:hypothetical protein L7F22_049204 [Adiantum nelumboides]|nr:hypothetical protein [Adiantum nelumboides]